MDSRVYMLAGTFLLLAIALIGTIISVVRVMRSGRRSRSSAAFPAEKPRVELPASILISTEPAAPVTPAPEPSVQPVPVTDGPAAAAAPAPQQPDLPEMPLIPPGPAPAPDATPAPAPPVPSVVVEQPSGALDAEEADVSAWMRSLPQIEASARAVTEEPLPSSEPAEQQAAGSSLIGLDEEILDGPASLQPVMIVRETPAALLVAQPPAGDAPSLPVSEPATGSGQAPVIPVPWTPVSATEGEPGDVTSAALQWLAMQAALDEQEQAAEAARQAAQEQAAAEIARSLELADAQPATAQPGEPEPVEPESVVAAPIEPEPIEPEPIEPEPIEVPVAEVPHAPQAEQVQGAMPTEEPDLSLVEPAAPLYEPESPAVIHEAPPYAPVVPAVVPTLEPEPVAAFEPAQAVPPEPAADVAPEPVFEAVLPSAPGQEPLESQGAANEPPDLSPVWLPPILPGGEGEPPTAVDEVGEADAFWQTLLRDQQDLPSIVSAEAAAVPPAPVPPVAATIPTVLAAPVERPPVIVHGVESGGSAYAPVGTPVPPPSRPVRPRAVVRLTGDLLAAPTVPLPAAVVPAPGAPLGDRAAAPAVTMAAPVEIWFGEYRVGVRAGTKTYDQFRRYADTLLKDLHDAAD